ncbi:choice-of-anchor D domain-containing protein [Leptospira sp. 2 VSF19]|uniref:Choice-of-anchor D domain-containing protein n=1 Tax=Leptospira soteropolitanensis TaxID=2950025 RepID=A0AAW5VGJ0_9LEPT|nr:choice-of-anchor D domain-containing protein [Leptospira soteropolitanensis]MCW7491979.1 choice-of-anchor D domain-containing protein [Leptospira soteropolitanensis]MCW7499562.1 choice-of-anchor D domain-containing protein [Leptospira soteropolitanensis]MCW7521813.1 choice-of-anchor D domain-containing protein [Leptospira soteropolitanensis]MCW7525666.1 choice-of-anchor D domain-containing protein [Leptospira soteropolitanensis]MCW7530219.1 choice-of-anchor D domain-containing protein [Lept
MQTPTSNSTLSNEIVVSAGIVPIPTGSSFIFGTLSSGETASRDFSIRNTSSKDWVLADSSAIQILGNDFSQFTLEWNGTKVIPAGQEIRFRVIFTPTSAGTKNSSVKISFSKTTDVISFQLQGISSTDPVPDIFITNNSNWIKSGASFNFGSIQENTTGITSQFKVQNLGTATLSITGLPRISVIGANANEFILIQDVSSSISAKFESNFTIKFAPTSSGSKFASLVINSNDPDNPSYVVSLSGTGTPTPRPKLSVLEGTVSKLNQSDLIFGKVVLNQSNQKRLTLKNTGDANLIFSSNAVLSGTNGNHYNLGNNITGVTLTPGQSLELSLNFSPSSLGAKIAQLALNSNDTSLILNLLGEGVNAPQPSITILDSSLVLSSNDSLSLGLNRVGSPAVEKQITIRNDGSGDLNFNSTPVTISGLGASHFRFISMGITKLSPSQSVTLTIQYIPTTTETHNAVLVVSTNDPTRPSFTLNLTGVGYPALCSGCPDTEAPLISKFQFLTNSASPGSTIVLRVFISDSQSSLRYIVVNIMSPTYRNTGKGQILAKFLENQDISSGYVDIPFSLTDGFENGEWRVSFLSATDSKLNSNQYSYRSDVSSSYLAQYIFSNNSYIPSILSTTQSVLNFSGGTYVDTTPPSLISFTPLVTSKNGSGSIPFRAQLSENNSSIYFFYVSMQSPIKAGSTYLRSYANAKMEYNSATGYFEGSSQIEDYFDNGNWEVTSISINDQFGNNIQYSLLPSYSESYFTIVTSPSITVSNIPIPPKIAISGLNSDLQVPVIQSIELVTPTASPGSNAIYKVYATDSGGASLGDTYATAEFVSPSRWTSSSNGNSISQSKPYNSLGGYYQFEFPVTNGLETGNWRLKKINFSDKNSNQAIYEKDSNNECNNKYFLSSNGGYTVSGINYSPSVTVSSSGYNVPSPDSTPPVLTSVQILTSNATPGSSIDFRIYASDAGSGLRSAYAYFMSPNFFTTGNGYTTEYIETKSYNAIGGYFEGTIKLKNYQQNGNWQIGNVFLYDNNSNSSIYQFNRSLSTSKYTLGSSVTVVNLSNSVLVSGMTIDSSPPVLSSVINSTGTRSGSGIATYYVQATDDVSGVASISLSIRNIDAQPTETKSSSCAFETNRWRCDVKFDAYESTSQWQVSAIGISDISGKSSTYQRDTSKSNTNFVLQGVITGIGLPAILNLTGMNPDTTPPTIQSISYNPTSINSCGFVTIKLKASDLNAGISTSLSAYLHSNTKFSTGSGTSLSTYFSYHQSTNEFISYVFLSSANDMGIWRLNEIRLNDKTENSIAYKYQPTLSTVNYATAKNSYDPIANWSVSGLPIGNGVNKQ